MEKWGAIKIMDNRVYAQRGEFQLSSLWTIRKPLGTKFPEKEPD